VRKVAVRRAGRTVQRRLLEARALARLVAGRAPAVAELPEPDAEVWRAVRALPRRQGQVIALRYVTDASVAEIARTLGMAEGRSRPSSTGAARPWRPAWQGRGGRP
jgi:DNA-directed RNA polymerase specialized sigma24 family protein